MTENGQQQSEQNGKYHPLRSDLQHIDDSRAPSQPAGVWSVVGMIANRLKTISGRSTWQDTPPTDLTEAHAHQQNKENPHVVTRAQLGAAAQTALDSHTAARDNPHGVTAAQAGARPATWVPSWNEVTGKPSTFAPAAHKGSHATGEADALAPGDIGAAPSHSHPYAPSSHTTSRTDHPAATATQDGRMAAADKTKLDGVRPNDAYADLTISANQTGIASGTWTPVFWNLENADPRNWHSNSTSPERITFDAAGFYALTFYQRWATANGSGVRFLRGLLNGGIRFEDSVSAAVDSVGRVTAARMLAVSAGDYLQLEVNQTSGSSLDLHSVTSVGVARLF